MNMNYKHLIIALIFLSRLSFGQENVYFHQTKYTDTEVEIVKWNIKDTLNISFVKEKVDNVGRVVELIFCYKNSHPFPGDGHYGGPIIKYEYSDSTITETAFLPNQQYAHYFNDSEVPFQFTYFFDKKLNITRVEANMILTFNWNKKSIEEIIKHLEFYKEYAPVENDYKNFNSVFGYRYSFVKYNGINLVRK